MSLETTNYLKSIGCKRDVSPPYDSNGNPLSEASNRIIDEPAFAAMLEACAPAEYWPEAQSCTVQLHNLAEFKAKDGKPISRYEEFTGRKPKCTKDDFYSFASKMYGYIPKDKRNSGRHPVKRKCYVGAYMGKSLDYNSNRMLILPERIIVEVAARFCVIHEGVYPFKMIPKTEHELALPPHWVTIEDTPWDEELLNQMDPEVDVNYKLFHPDTVEKAYERNEAQKRREVENSPMEALPEKRSRAPSEQALRNWEASSLPTTQEISNYRAAPSLGQGNE